MQIVVGKIIEDAENQSKRREYVIQGAEILNEAKEIISSALTSYPPAALAFSGLCATLPVNPVLSIFEGL